MRSSPFSPLAGLLLLTLFSTIWFHAFGMTGPANAQEPSPRQLLERAKVLEEQKEYAKALDAYHQYLVVRPDNDEVRATTAKLLSWQGQWDDAVVLYREVLAHQPLDHDSRAGLARVLSWQKKFDEAQEQYEQILRDEPSHVEALTGLGDVLLWGGHQEQAILYYERIVAVTGDAEVAARFHAMKGEVVQPVPVPAPTADPVSPDSKQVLERGRRLETIRDYVEAAALYREALQRSPGNDELRTALARVLSWQGAHVEATTLYRDLLVRHPEDRDIRVALAQVLSWQQQFDEAHLLYEQVLEADPRQIEARRGLAEVAHWRGDRSEALQRYEALLSETHDPQIEAQLNAVKVELLADSKPTRAAAPDPNTSTQEVEVRAITSAMERATRFEVAKQYREAEAVYREVLQQYPRNDEVRSALARVLSWQGAHAEAAMFYREVLAHHPADQDVRVALAQVLSWQQQFDEAHLLYEQVLEADPRQIEARRGLAEVAHWRGERSQALQRYEALLAETQDPDIEQRLRAVKSELLVSPRAAVGQGLIGLRLPYRDYAKIGYGHYSYTKNQPDERDLLFEIAKPFGNQTLVLRAEPINRFGFHDTPLSAELYSPLWQRAWGYIAAQGTINPRFSPNYSFIGEVAQGLGGLHASLAPLEVSFGYRRLNYKQDDIDLLMPGLTIFLPFNLWLTEKVYLIPNTGAVTLSSQLTWRPTDRLQFFASGSFGTSGERIVAAQDFTRVASRTIQGGATFPITERFSAEAAGYYEDRGFLYIRRGGNLSLIYHW
ncbi:MAG: tetratricopeptide repeat protein [Nitrospira sp.]|nr:tetratricopeptide repeat protein [Nitrospira sp.]